MSTGKRGFSVVEVMVALAIVSLVLVPVLSLLRPGSVEVSARLSSASYLLGRLLQTVRHMPYAKLKDLLAKSPDVANGYRRVGIDGLVPDPAAAVGGLAASEVELYVRSIPDVGGQYGLDRVDLKLAFGAGDQQRFLTRSFVKRNARELACLARLRLYRPIDDLSDEQFHAAVKAIAHQTALMPMAQRKDGSPFLVPAFPGTLKNFEGFDADPAAGLGENEEGLGGADGQSVLMWGDQLSDGEASRPRFAPTAGICD